MRRLILIGLGILSLLSIPAAHPEETAVSLPLIFVVEQPKYLWCGEVAELFGGNVIDSRLDFSGMAGTGTNRTGGMSNNGQGQRLGEDFGR